jgi:trimethylamine--corrinoid protein Co-methyltransferase
MEMIVLGNELIAMCRRYAGGTDIGDSALAADVIDAVGPGGAFLDSEHTRANFRAAMWIPRLMDRRRWDAWKAAGSTSLFDRLNAEARAVLARHHPEPLPADRQRDLARIIERRGVGKG